MFKIYRLPAIVAFSTALFSYAVAQKSASTRIPHYTIPAEAHDGEDYMSKTIIFKVKPEYRNLCSPNDVNYAPLKTFMKDMGVQNFFKIYPYEKAPQREFNERGQKLVDLTLIYEYTFTANISLQQALDKISRLGIFEYAETHQIPKAMYNVNDVQVGSQYHIPLIKAPQAWDISQGDSTIIVGIVDTGTEPSHPDLKDNIKHNYNDPIDGIDNDNDGYVDNFSGWDVGLNDNDPTWQGQQHGVHVSGIASASTDNNTGVAGTGFKCMFLPVKIADASGTLTASYVGIQYAAAHGCKVINCSWGGAGGGQYAQDVINAATFNYDALVVAAAGNNGNESILSPGDLDNVLCVAATTTTDTKAGFSNYGYKVRISAPGENIYSTYSGTGYATLSGTSMASPCTAGAVALVRAYFPTYTALQAAARLCATADHIDSLNSGTLKNKLGTGRVNLYRALAGASVPSILLTNKVITDGNDNAPVAGDTLRIAGTFTNFLAPTSNLSVVLSTTSTFVTIIASTATVNLGAVSTMGTGDNNSSPFLIKIKNTAPQNTDVIFKVTYTDGTYSASEFFDVVVNVDYLNVTVNDIESTITSKGMIGWNNDPPSQGLGFKYKGVSMFYDAGLMIGTPDSNVSNVVRGVSTKNTDFTPTIKLNRVSSNAQSDFDTEGYFNDAGAQKPLPILVHHKSYAWSTPGDRKFIMYRYIIHNAGTAVLDSLYAGICADFDIQGPGGDSNRVSFDSLNRLGYTYYTKNNGLYGGIKVLTTSAATTIYAFDNTKTGNGGLNLYDGFSRREKYLGLSKYRKEAGVTGAGNDVVESVSTGPYKLNPGDSVEVAFSIIAGDDLADLELSASNAQIKYDNLLLSTSAIGASESAYLRAFPNPASGITTIEITMPRAGQLDLKLYDLVGKETAVIASGEFTAGKHQFSLDASKFGNGVYFYSLSFEGNKTVRKLIVSK